MWQLTGPLLSSWLPGLCLGCEFDNISSLVVPAWDGSQDHIGAYPRHRQLSTKQWRGGDEIKIVVVECLGNRISSEWRRLLKSKA